MGRIAFSAGDQLVDQVLCWAIVRVFTHFAVPYPRCFILRSVPMQCHCSPRVEAAELAFVMVHKSQHYFAGANAYRISADYVDYISKPQYVPTKLEYRLSIQLRHPYIQPLLKHACFVRLVFLDADSVPVVLHVVLQPGDLWMLIKTSTVCE